MVRLLIKLLVPTSAILLALGFNVHAQMSRFILIAGNVMPLPASPALIATPLAMPRAFQDRQQPPPEPPEAYPGQRTHQQPPDGFMCVRQTIRLDVPPEHACTCERMYSPEDGHVMDDQKCTTWCWPLSCGCGIGGKPMTPADPQCH